MALNPLGLHVQAQGKGFNRAELLAHVKRANYITCSVLDDQQLAIDMAIPYAVFRAYSFEPAANANADTVFAQIKAWVDTHPGGRNILYNVNCEAQWSKSRNDLYARLIELSANAPGGAIGLCLGNYGSGTIKSGQGSDPNWWATPDAENLLRTLHKYRDVKLPNGSYAFVLAAHEYTGIHPWIATNGGELARKPLWHERPTAIDWTKPQWHLGRAAQGVIGACKQFGIQPPHMLITECLIDDMDDVAYTFGNRATGLTGLKTSFGVNKKARGWRSLIPQWAEWYAGHDVDGGGVYAEMLAWVWETIYKPLGFVIGMNTYTWASTGDWETFRVDNAPGYISKIEAYTGGTPPHVPPPTQPATTAPPASDPRWYSTDAHTYNSPVNIRADATQMSADLGDFQAGESQPKRVKTIYLPGQAYQPFFDGTTRGWIHTAYVKLGDPPMPTAADARWRKARARPPGASEPLRDWPNATARKLLITVLLNGLVETIPMTLLEPMERAYLNSWGIVKVGMDVGYVPPEVLLELIVDNPPAPSTVTIPQAEYDDLTGKAAALVMLQKEYTELESAQAFLTDILDKIGVLWQMVNNEQKEN